MHRVQNVDIALMAAEEGGCVVGARADDVANGVRDATLHLLWSLFQGLQVRL